MKIDAYSHGTITVNGITYDHDLVVAEGNLRKRDKEPSKSLAEEFGHTPLTTAEDISWGARALWIGTGVDGSLPVADCIVEEAERRGIELLVMPTPELIPLINQGLPLGTTLILHVTC